MHNPLRTPTPVLPASGASAVAALCTLPQEVLRAPSTAMTSAVSSRSPTASHVAAFVASQRIHTPTTVRLAFSYARQSEEFPDGIARQHEENARVAAALGFTIPDSPEFRFSDDDTSGKLKSRDAFNRLLDRITNETSTVGALFIRERSRIGRWNDPRRHDYYAVLFADRGVPIVESCDPHWVDWDNDTSDEVTLRFLHSTLKSIQSRNERIEIVKRTNRGTRANLKQGYYTLKAPYYGTDRWVAWAHSREPFLKLEPGVRYARDGCGIVLRWATDGSIQVVRDIFAWIMSGRSLGWIARELTQRHVQPPSARYATSASGGRWHKEIVRRIARNPIYRGDLLYGRTSKRFRGQEPVLAPQAHCEAFGMILYLDFLAEPPISRGDFEAVQERLDQNMRQHAARSRKRRPYALSGVLTCTTCSRSLHGFCSAPDRLGAVRTYYRHSISRGRGTRCPHENRYVLATPLDTTLAELVQDALADGRLQDLLAAEVTRYLDDPRQRARAEELQACTKEIQDLERELDRLCEELGQCTQATWERSLRTRKDRLVSRLDTLATARGALAREEAHLVAVEHELIHSGADLVSLRLLYDGAPDVVRVRVRDSLLESVQVDFGAHRVDFRVRAATTATTQSA
ncbi:MAG: recombinase family protein [Gemmatimonadota bacterium]